MPPPKLKNHPGKRQKDGVISKYASKYVNVEYVKSLLFDPSKLHIVSSLILLAELFLNIFVVQTVSYTEIDWKAYMQECQGFLNGTTNYSLLKGDTGPLVYPAGFVYVYTLFYYLTSSGTNVKLAQYVFIFIYLAQMYLVLRLYRKSRKVPPYLLLITTFTSYRIHSIYVLRLFNDPIAILFAYAAFNLFLDQRWTLGSICFSLGVSVKMNILLFAPAILLLYLTNLGYVKTAIQLAVCAILQAILGAPFLITYPVEYIKGSFDLGRIFEHKWTVNYRFLSRDIFENKSFHMGLLVLHLTLLVVFCSPCYKFMQSYARLRALQTQLQPQIDRKNAEVKAAASKKAKLKMKSKEKLNEGELTAEQEKFIQAFEKSIQQSTGLSKPLEEKEEEEESSYSIHFDKATQLPLLPIFLANLIGVACARSLHYQFYVWYFHSLPYLAWFTDFSLTQKFLILGLIEYSWNTYPSTDYSSFVLHSCHIVLLFGIAKKLFKSKTDSEKLKDK